MTIAPRAARYASSIPHSHPTSCIWVSDDLLSDAIRRFSHTFRRHGSSVPGPLEARRRAARRHHANLATMVGGAPPPDIATLFDSGEPKGWWKDPLAEGAGPTKTPRLSFFDLANDLTTNLDVRPPQPWIPPEPPPIVLADPSSSAIGHTAESAKEATRRFESDTRSEAAATSLCVEQLAIMTVLEDGTNEKNEAENFRLDKYAQALSIHEASTLEEVELTDTNTPDLSEDELHKGKSAVFANQADIEAYKPFVDAAPMPQEATQAAIHVQDAVLTTENTTSHVDMKLLLDDAAYQRLKHRDVHKIELFASLMNAGWPEFLQRSKTMLKADRTSAKLLIRILRHNIELQTALGRGQAHATVVSRRRSRSSKKTSPSTAGPKLVLPDAEQFVADIARLLALQPGFSPKSRWNRVYWCYQYIKHHQGYVSGSILPALWHAGVTNYLHQGLAQTRRDWLLNKIAVVGSKALAQALFKDAGFREQYENGFRSGNQLPFTSYYQSVHPDKSSKSSTHRECQVPYKRVVSRIPILRIRKYPVGYDHLHEGSCGHSNSNLKIRKVWSDTADCSEHS